MNKLILLFAAVVLVGCTAIDYSAKDMSELEVGMTKQQVVAAKGKPLERSVNGETEYLIYAVILKNVFYPEGVPHDKYYVRLVEGKVNSFGKLGDFNSTQDPVLKLILKKRKR